MINTIDLKDTPCPGPVLEVRKVLLEGKADPFKVLLDNKAARENVTRLVLSMNGAAELKQETDEEIVLLITPAEPQTIAGKISSSSQSDGPELLRPEAAPGGNLATSEALKTVILLCSDLVGNDDRELGRILMRAFIKTLSQMQPLPKTMLFLNSGVKLTTSGSDLLSDLRSLEEAGVTLLSCGTCLDYYHQQDALEVGRTTSMFEVISVLGEAGRVIRP